METPSETILIEFAKLCTEYPNEAKITLWEQARQNIFSPPEIQSYLNEAARAIYIQLFPDRWADWIVYLLKALQEQASDEDYRNMLLDLISAIETRVLEEQW